MKENIMAIPSKGKFRDEALDLLSQAGIPLKIPGRQMAIEASLPEVGSFTVALLRPKDIVKLISDNQIPLGIAGEDTVAEFGLSSKDRWDYSNINSLLKLGIGNCRLVLAAPVELGARTRKEIEEIEKEKDINPLDQFRGLTIATSYPNLTRFYIGQTEPTVGPRKYEMYPVAEQLTGSVEAAPQMGLGNIIADLVETGQSLRENGLREIDTILESEGVLLTQRWTDGRNNLVYAVRDRLAEALA